MVAEIPRVDANVRVTTPSRQRIEQNNESDMVFIDKLARRNAATFYERDRKLYFGPRRNDAPRCSSWTGARVC